MVRPEIKWPDHLRESRFHGNPVGGVEMQSEAAESDWLSFRSRCRFSHYTVENTLVCIRLHMAGLRISQIPIQHKRLFFK